jgi:hypothetical protein
LKFTPNPVSGFPLDSGAKYKATACGKEEQEDGLTGREDILYKSRTQVESPLLFYVKKRYSSPVTGLEWRRGFQEVKVPRFHDNGTGWW